MEVIAGIDQPVSVDPPVQRSELSGRRDFPCNLAQQNPKMLLEEAKHCTAIGRDRRKICLDVEAKLWADGGHLLIVQSVALVRCS